MSKIHGAINVDVRDITVQFHCDQSNGQSSYRVCPTGDGIVIYLYGTPEQLGRFADAIVRTVSQHTIAVHEQTAADAASLQNARGLAFVTEAVTNTSRKGA
jgi:hypothetical protein